MQLGQTYHTERARWGKPLAGLTVLAAEHMQALPYATLLLAVLGADVVKVEAPGGEGGRAARPIVPEPDGTTVGGTFARNNLNKSSIVLDLKNTGGKATFLRLAAQADIVAENIGTGSPVVMPGNPIKMSRLAEGPLRTYPSPGEHTAQVLSELLGLDPGEIEGLRERGAFGG